MDLQSEVGPGWGKLPGLDETQRDSVGRSSISLMQRLVLHRVFLSLSQSCWGTIARRRR